MTQSKPLTPPCKRHELKKKMEYVNWGMLGKWCNLFTVPNNNSLYMYYDVAYNNIFWVGRPKLVV